MAAGRFLQLTDVAEILNISSSQTYALVRSGELPAIKIGGRGQWRVERTVLEDYIQRCYAETRAFVQRLAGVGDEALTDESPSAPAGQAAAHQRDARRAARA